MLLGKVQELDIVRAGTVGNVRIVDYAAVNIKEPVEPRKAIVVVFVTLLGFGLAIAFVWIQRTLNRGLEDPAIIDSMGIPVYATIPQSKNISKKKKKLH